MNPSQEKTEKCATQQSNQGISLGISDIAEILVMLDKHDVVEFEFEREQTKLRLKRSSGVAVFADAGAVSRSVSAVPMIHESTTPQSNQAKSPDYVDVTPSVGSVSAESVKLDSVTNSVMLGKVLKEITSPMVGTFYRRPAVDAEPYVSEGDVIKKGTVLCIVEAMKIMNEIESEFSGRIVEVCLEDGQMVEYGEVLFRVEPS